MSSLTEGLIVVATSIVGVATLSVIVSKNANTSQVIQAGGNAFSSAIAAAVSPVTGSSLGGLGGLSGFNSGSGSTYI